MKKGILLISMALATAVSNAQFFESTTYKGAFGNANSENWTDGWTNWDPENTAYNNTTDEVFADITTNTTWYSSKVYLLKNKIYVTNGAT